MSDLNIAYVNTESVSYINMIWNFQLNCSVSSSECGIVHGSLCILWWIYVVVSCRGARLRSRTLIQLESVEILFDIIWPVQLSFAITTASVLTIENAKAFSDFCFTRGSRINIPMNEGEKAGKNVVEGVHACR